MNKNFLKRVKRRDRIARSIITIGGMLIIGSVVLILLLIGKVTLPLFQKPDSRVFSSFDVPPQVRQAEILDVGVDEYLAKVFVLTADGAVTFFETSGGTFLKRIELEPPAEGAVLTGLEKTGDLLYQVRWSDGTQTLDKIVFTAEWDKQSSRTFAMDISREASMQQKTDEKVQRSLARIGSDGRKTRVDLLADGRLQVSQLAVTETLFGDEEVEEHDFIIDDLPPEPITALTLDGDGAFLYAGTERGALLRWSLEIPGEPQLLDRRQAFEDERRITSLAMILGDISLAVGDERGKLTTWFPVQNESGERKLHLIHTLPDHFAPVTDLIPSQRDKSILSLDADGIIHLDHMTSERHLLSLANPSPLVKAAISSRGNGIVALTDEDGIVLWKINNPHPEISFKTLFGKVWYESYPEPAYVWQSSSASDDAEPKLSLTPLIFGTLKGTFYAMILAVPLALLGAIYTSQFGNPAIRRWIKPTVEIMAAIPTVIIGFLAALWFAPLVERNIGGLFLSFAMAPAAIAITLVLWQWVRSYGPARRIERGFEFLTIAPVIVIGVAAAVVLGPWFEQIFFDGNFQLWLFQETGTRYDQRNNIVIAFALGFAVIPIIFTIAEDALSNVPGSMKAASLAMGASRWQTVWRVVLPSASPGIFAGVMIGFGRAIGETMIVLMATGNTPIMDWSIFNGMRPLSANIAVEIPEAPHGGTLYRILFLSACLLFAGTFILNTAAEIVRHRLRKKYGRF
ncbi:MAG: ABC transporter permease subunit [Desulfuromonadales bacterium]